jgi:hypothetical protein
MNHRNIITLSSIASLGFAVLPGSGTAQAQDLKHQLVGSWSIVQNCEEFLMAKRIAHHLELI